jgi:hypothetical protein
MRIHSTHGVYSALKCRRPKSSQNRMRCRHEFGGWRNVQFITFVRLYRCMLPRKLGLLPEGTVAGKQALSRPSGGAFEHADLSGMPQ